MFSKAGTKVKISVYNTTVPGFRDSQCVAGIRVQITLTKYKNIRITKFIIIVGIKEYHMLSSDNM
jgi:hypothetical protein